eukprot:Em0007g1212a
MPIVSLLQMSILVPPKHCVSLGVMTTRWFFLFSGLGTSQAERVPSPHGITTTGAYEQSGTFGLLLVGLERGGFSGVTHSKSVFECPQSSVMTTVSVS